MSQRPCARRDWIAAWAEIGDTVSVTVGLLNPGEMGAAIGAALRATGHTVLWSSHGRSRDTVRRAGQADLVDVGSVDELKRQADVILSVCPPHAAVDVARLLGGFAGIFVDANAISPITTREIAPLVDRFVDGGIIGPPPRERGTTRLYLSGPEADTIAELFAGTSVEARVVSREIGAASATKLTYAAWSKGTQALLLAIRAVARANGIEQTLLEEWSVSQPALPDRSAFAGHTALAKGWRWQGEMNEIADTFAAAGLPDGFHRAAAEIYRRTPQGLADADDALDQVLDALPATPPR